MRNEHWFRCLGGGEDGLAATQNYPAGTMTVRLLMARAAWARSCNEWWCGAERAVADARTDADQHRWDVLNNKMPFLTCSSARAVRVNRRARRQ